LANFVFFLINAKIFFVESIYVTAPLTVWVGFMGGASYVNVTHGIRELNTLKLGEKESAMSLCMLFNDTGIFFASGFSLILGSTFLKVDGISNN